MPAQDSPRAARRPDGLEARLLAAHASGDKTALASLYGEAGDAAEAGGDRARAAFFLTHAWIFALDAGLDEAARLEKRLQDWGRAPV